MAKTQTLCPRCRQPMVADIQQLFDTTVDPDAKQRFLSGQFNISRCQNCGYEGMTSSPLVYHDAEKELLLTYFPPELGLPVNEQERLVGPLINQVVNHLPNEKRKAYLFRPQNMLTLQTMVEKVLEGEGITKEMIQASQQRLNLLQRLLTTQPELRSEIIQQEEALINDEFFALISRLAQSSMAQNDQESTRALAGLQKQLLEETTAGRALKEKVSESEAAVKSLQEASQKGLTREALLDLVIEAPTDTRVETLVSMARSGMDYTFFQLLAERIDKAAGDERVRLEALRQKLLELTAEIDKAMQEEIKATRAALDEIANAADTEQAIQKNAGLINELFFDLLKSELLAAREKGDLERSAKLQKVASLLEKMTAPPPEVMLIQELVEAESDTARQQVLQNHAAEINNEFLQAFSALVQQLEQQGQPPEFMQQLQEAYRAALRFSMAANLKK